MDTILAAWRKGDLVELPNKNIFRLTSEGYYSEKLEKIVCDTDKGETISCLTLIKKAKLIETGTGKKNIAT